MRATLAKCSLMLGAKAAPTDEEYFILKDVMQEKFIDFGSEEVETAFKQLIAGQLDCEPDKYGKISAAYLGQVLIESLLPRFQCVEFLPLKKILLLRLMCSYRFVFNYTAIYKIVNEFSKLFTHYFTKK
jgi:hypothetical protein